MLAETQHQFSARESDWGFTSFMPLSELYNNDQGDDDEIGRVSSRTMAVELEFACVMFSCLFSAYFRGRAPPRACFWSV